MRDLWWKRTGIISGFILLDHNDDGLLTLDEFIDFVLFLRSDVKRTDIVVLFRMLDTDHSGTIELNEFVHGVERLSDDYNQGFDRNVLDRVISRRDSSQSASGCRNVLAITEMVWLSWSMNKLRGFVFIANFWIFCWINTDVVSNGAIEAAAKLFLCAHTADVAVKVVAMTPHRYWNWSRYHRNEIVAEFASLVLTATPSL